MVAKKVIVITKAAGSDKAWKWESEAFFLKKGFLT
jgi:HSP90 family molecular chaperone